MDDSKFFELHMHYVLLWIIRINFYNVSIGLY